MSNMKRCEKGHYYEAEKYSSCPHCGVTGLDLQPTHGRPPSATDPSPTRPLHVPSRPGAEGKTIGIIQKRIGINPVLGWLVCVEGAERGRDFRIRGERSSIGRDPSMDIYIEGDESISRYRHAVISFNPRTHTFKVVPGEGGGQTYLNGEVVDVPIPLKSYDLIELGQTKLLFIPLCGEQFQWDTPQS